MGYNAIRSIAYMNTYIDMLGLTTIDVEHEPFTYQGPSCYAPPPSEPEGKRFPCAPWCKCRKIV